MREQGVARNAEREKGYSADWSGGTIAASRSSALHPPDLRRSFWRGELCVILLLAPRLSIENVRVHRVRNASDKITLRNAGRGAIGNKNAGRGRNNRGWFSIRPLEKVNLRDRLTRRHLRSKINQGFEYSRFRGKPVILSIQRLHPLRRGQTQIRTRHWLAPQDTGMIEHIAQTALA